MIWQASRFTSVVLCEVQTQVIYVKLVMHCTYDSTTRIWKIVVIDENRSNRRIYSNDAQISMDLKIILSLSWSFLCDWFSRFPIIKLIIGNPLSTCIPNYQISRSRLTASDWRNSELSRKESKKNWQRRGTMSRPSLRYYFLLWGVLPLLKRCVLAIPSKRW